MASVKKWYELGHEVGGLNIPGGKCHAILTDPAYTTEEEKKEALMLYYLHTVAMASWQHVVGALHFRNEVTALQAAEVFLNKCPHPTGKWMCICGCVEKLICQ